MEEKVQRANVDIADYEAKLALMENEISRIQKAWRLHKSPGTNRPASIDKVIETDQLIESKMSSRPTVTKSSQTEIKMRSIETQCAICCKSLIEKNKDEADQNEQDTDVVIQDEAEDLSKGMILL